MIGRVRRWILGALGFPRGRAAAPSLPPLTSFPPRVVTPSGLVKVPFAAPASQLASKPAPPAGHVEVLAGSSRGPTTVHIDPARPVPFPVVEPGAFRRRRAELALGLDVHVPPEIPTAVVVDLVEAMLERQRTEQAIRHDTGGGAFGGAGASGSWEERTARSEPEERGPVYDDERPTSDTEGA